MQMNDLKEEILSIKREVIDIRRDIHAHPELGFQEHRTSKFVSDYLSKEGITFIDHIGKTGVVGLIKGDTEGKTLMLRADMDALPINELNDVEYRSLNSGVMHACGHDGHVAILLVAAKILNKHRSDLKGSVKLVFQPSEEKDPGGAIEMINEGVLENPKVDYAFGLHLGGFFDHGKILSKKGIFTAQADRFIIRIKGKGSHGAYPHNSVDPVLIASHIVTALQSIVSREINPVESAVVSVGKISSGDVFNVIPETAEIEGTVRTLDKKNALSVKDSIERISMQIALALKGSAELEYHFGYPPLFNNSDCIDFLVNVAAQVVGTDKYEEAPISMGGEDMSYFLEKVPGAFFWLGAKNPVKGIDKPNHSPYFDIDEDVLPIGVEMFVKISLELLKNP